LAHHVYAQGTWLPKLLETADAEEQATVTKRYDGEFAAAGNRRCRQSEPAPNAQACILEPGRCWRDREAA
jgi:hypothetical protein